MKALFNNNHRSHSSITYLQLLMQMLSVQYNVFNTYPKGANQMKASQDFIKQLELLYEQYEKEVLEKQHDGILEEKTAKTYIRHSSTFVRWVRNDFEPGVRKASKR